MAEKSGKRVQIRKKYTPTSTIQAGCLVRSTNVHNVV